MKVVLSFPNWAHFLDVKGINRSRIADDVVLYTIITGLGTKNQPVRVMKYALPLTGVLRK